MKSGKCVLIGGTFDGLHKGHREFIRKAFELGGDKVLICLTSDSMMRDKVLALKIEKFGARKRKLINYLGQKKWIGRAEIVKIENPFTEGLRPGLTRIIVSRETRANAEKINAMRTERHLPPMEIVEIRWVTGEDGKPISDARIRKGEIDAEGNILPSGV